MDLELTASHREILEQAAEAVVHVGRGVVEDEGTGLVDDVVGKCRLGIAGVGDRAAVDVEVTGRCAGAAGKAEGAAADLADTQGAEDGVVVSKEAAVEGGAGIVKTERERLDRGGVVGDVARAGELAENLIEVVEVQAAGAGHGEGGGVGDGVVDTEEDRSRIERGGTGVVVDAGKEEAGVAELGDATGGADHRRHGEAQG